jgi:alpha-L-fucosidase
MVTIIPDNPTLPIHFTLDGTEPSAKSTLYKGPFMLANGGTLKAAAFTKAREPGDMRTAIFGIGKKGWKIIEAPAGSHGENAIDEDENSNWSTLTEELSGRIPVDIAVDMGKPHLIKAFTYLPRQDKKTEGLIGRYAFYTSNNSRDWVKISEGDFHNIEANPVQQLVLLQHPVEARYFKFSALHINTGKGVAVAELGIISR